MQMIPAKIGALGDPPLFPEHSDTKEAKILAFSVLEGGMQSGKTSCGFIVEIDGRKGFAQLSNDMMQNLAAIAKGADQRFAEKRRK